MSVLAIYGIHWRILFARDFEVEDGWELLNFKPGESTYVVLYNKFTSILRLLFLLPQSQEDYDAISVKFEFDPPTNQITGAGTLTALFHPLGGINQPLDEQSIKLSKTTSIYTNSNSLFMHVDVPVEYDPCTCLTSGSNLKFTFSKIDEMDLSLYGRSIEIERTLSSITGGNGFVEDDYLTQVLLDGQLGDKAGAHTFQSWNTLLNHYKDLKEERSELARRYEFYKLFGEITKLVKGTSILKGIKLSTVLFPDTTYTYNRDSTQIDTTATGFQIKTDGNAILDFIAGSVGLLGAPIKSKLDAVNGKINVIGSTNFSHSEMVLRGRIVDDSPVGSGLNMSTPGSASTVACDASISQVYPKYNEILGRFAVLETPVLLYEERKSPIPQQGDDTPEEIYDINVFTKFDPSSFEYVFNPAAQINETATEVYASVQITARYIPVSFRSSIVSQRDGVSSQNMLFVQRDSLEATYTTPLMPIECIGEYIGQLNVRDMRDLAITDVKLTVYVEYTFDETDAGGNLQKAIQFYKYPMQLKPANLSDAPPYGPIHYTPAYKYRDTIRTTHFTSSQTIFAWTSIYIEGRLTTAPGVQVDVISPSITVAANSFVGPNIDLYNDFTPFRCQVLNPVDRSDVVAFCKSTKYQANRSSLQNDDTALQSGTETPTPVPQTELGQPLPEQIELAVSPNPVGDYASIRLLLPADEAVQLNIVDMSGRILRTLLDGRQLPAGTHYFDLPAADLKPGTYLLRATTARSVEVLRFVR